MGFSKPPCLHGAGALLPHLFNFACEPRTRGTIGRVFSVPLSVGSPRLRVRKHPALWSPDFPRRSEERRGRPACSTHSIPRPVSLLRGAARAVACVRIVGLLAGKGIDNTLRVLVALECASHLSRRSSAKADACALYSRNHAPRNREALDSLGKTAGCRPFPDARMGRLPVARGCSRCDCGGRERAEQYDPRDCRDGT